MCKVKTKPKPKPNIGFGFVPETTSLETGFYVQLVWIWFKTGLEPVCQKNQFFFFKPVLNQFFIQNPVLTQFSKKLVFHFFFEPNISTSKRVKLC